MAWKEEQTVHLGHHAGLVVWSTLREAKLSGHAVDEPVLAELTKWVAELGRRQDGKFRGPPVGPGTQCQEAMTSRPTKPGGEVRA